MTSQVVRVVALLLAVVGAVDAARGDHWDQFGILIALAALLIVDLGVRRFAPPTVAVRPDLAEWLREEASRTDDAPGRLADRALATYRASGGLPSGPPHPE